MKQVFMSHNCENLVKVEKYPQLKKNTMFPRKKNNHKLMLNPKYD